MRTKYWFTNLFKHEVDKLNILPTTIEELDVFVAKITKEFNLPEGDATYDTIASMIFHMPPSACRAPMRYFGESVLKALSNAAAYPKLEEFREKRLAEAQRLQNLALEKKKAEEEKKAQAEQWEIQNLRNAENTLPVRWGQAAGAVAVSEGFNTPHLKQAETHKKLSLHEQPLSNKGI